MFIIFIKGFHLVNYPHSALFFHNMRFESLNEVAFVFAHSAIRNA
jgi:hypothetical protein